MLSQFSKRKLVKMLEKLDEAETHVEALRQILCSQDDFEPYQLFKQVSNKGQLDSTDIQRLLQKNGLVVQVSDIVPVLKWYSQRSDGKLSYADFMNIVLPANNPQLRQQVTQRQKQSTEISYEIEYALSRVLHKEVQIWECLNSHKCDLLSQPDFDLRSAFQTIDQYSSGQIQIDQVEQLVSGNAVNIMRRLDQNRDGQVDMEDFRLALEPTTELKCKPQSQQMSRCIVQEENKFPNRRAKQSIQKHINRNSSQLQPRKPEQVFDMDYLVEALKIITELEHESEVCKESLGYLQYDLLELYSIFDVDATGKLTPGDIQAVLEDLGIYPTQAQLFLWMKRFDLDRDGKWSVREFMLAFKPMNYQKLNSRKMDNEVLEAIKELIKTEIENEVAIECIRQKLAKRPNFNLKQLFRAITQRQVILQQDLICLMENQGVKFDQRRWNLLMHRFDRQEQDYITYSDFLNELYPKKVK